MKKLALRLALVAAGLVFGLGLVELGLHLFPGLLPPAVRQALAIYADSHATADLGQPFVPDDQLIYVPRIGVDLVIHDGLTLSYTVQTRSLGGSTIGFRDDDPGGQPYAAATGDSQTWGTYVAAEETWPNQLEAALGAPVLNMAVLGYAPPQYAVITEQYALPLHPRVLLWGFFAGNDASNSTDYARWVEAGRPPTTPSQSESGLRAFLSRNVRLYELLKFEAHAGIYYQRSASAQAVSVPAPGGPDWIFYPATLEELADGTQPAVAEGWTVAEAAILQGQAAAQAARARLVVVVIPPKELIYQSLWGGRVPGSESFDLAEPEHTLMAFCAANSVDCVDLAPAFEAQSAAEELYLRQDAHLSPAGHHLAALLVKDYLAQHGMWP